MSDTYYSSDDDKSVYTDSYNSDNDNDNDNYRDDIYKDSGFGVVLNIFLEKGELTKEVSFCIKYYNCNDAYEADSRDYEEERGDIETIIYRRNPGWNIKDIVTQEFSEYIITFDLDKSRNP